MAYLYGKDYDDSLTEVIIPLARIDTRIPYQAITNITINGRIYNYTGTARNFSLESPENMDLNTFLIDLKAGIGFLKNESSFRQDWLNDQFPTDGTWHRIADMEGTLPTVYLSISNSVNTASFRIGDATTTDYKTYPEHDCGLCYFSNSPNYMGCWSYAQYSRDRFILNVVFRQVNEAYEISTESGEPGFVPIKTIVNIRGGGKTSGSKAIYTTEKLVNPDAPDESKASAISSGFINAYQVSKEDLERVGQCIWADNIHSIIGGKITSPMDALISLSIFPTKPESNFPENIKFLNHEFNALTFGVNALGKPLMKQFKKISFGSINVYECFESFLDYANTNFSIYLPFIGEVSLPINEVMGGKITLDYIIDFFTGMCVANVLCEKVIDFAPNDAAEQYSQHSYQGNCAIQVPLSSGDYGALVGALINMCSTGLRETLETGNPAVGAASAGLEGAKELLAGGMSPAVKTKGSISANAGYCSVYYPYITIERPISPQPDSYQTAHGYMSYTNSRLSEYEGLCVCEDINLSGIFNATDSEKARIKTMCREGVYV